MFEILPNIPGFAKGEEQDGNVRPGVVQSEKWENVGVAQLHPDMSLTSEALKLDDETEGQRAQCTHSDQLLAMR